MKFRCKYRQQLNSVSTFKIAETSGTTGSGSTSETGKNTHQERINNIWSPSSELRSSSSPGDRSSQFSPDTRSTSSSGSPAAVTSGLRFAKRKQKESLEELSELSPKRSSATFLSSPSPTGSASSMSPPQLNPDPRRSELSHQDDHAKSAFQRVDKILVTPGAHQLNKPTNLTSSAVISPRESPPSFATSSSVLTPTTALNMSLADKSIDIGLLPHGGMMLFPNFPRLAVHRGHEGLQRLPVANENAPYYAAAAAMNGLHYMNNNNNNINKSGLKMPPCLPTDPRMAAAAAALPFFYRAPNPMMGKMFHPAAAAAAAAAAGPPIPSTFAALNLTQNWCAKCNTSFRMTSDLVYHMRSHHKREFDPVKKKKDDKLKCDVCGESFRERHHLTRHMTSHTWAIMTSHDVAFTWLVRLYYLNCISSMNNFQTKNYQKYGKLNN